MTSNIILIAGILMCIVVRLPKALPATPWSCVFYFSRCEYFEKLTKLVTWRRNSKFGSQESEWICIMWTKVVPSVYQYVFSGGGGGFSVRSEMRCSLVHKMCLLMYENRSEGISVVWSDQDSNLGGGEPFRPICSKLRFCLLNTIVFRNITKCK